MRNPFLLMALLLAGLSVFGQENTKTQLPAGNKVREYLDVAGDHAVIYSGKEQQKYISTINNHPYFITDEYVKGTLSYDGIVYPDVELKLDLHRGELIVRTPNRIFNVVVQRDKVDYADFNSFRIVPAAALEGNFPLSGYYIELYHNEYRILEKRLATYHEVVEHQKLKTYFQFHKPVYYLIKGEQFHSFRSEAALLRIFKTRKKELKHYIKQNRLSFKRDPQQTIVETVKQYELLNRQP